jgi:hypothetical protein
MGIYDWLLILIMGLGLLVGLIRGFKAHYARAGGDVVAFLAALAISLPLTAFLIGKNENLSAQFLDLEGKLGDKAGYFTLMIFALILFIPLAIGFFALNRFFLAHVGYKRPYIFFATFIAYLAGAFLVGMIIAGIVANESPSSFSDGTAMLNLFYNSLTKLTIGGLINA